MVMLPWLLLLAGVVHSAAPRNYIKPKVQETHFVEPEEQNFVNPKPHQEQSFDKAIKQEPHFVDGKYQASYLVKTSSKPVEHSANDKNKEPHYVTSPEKDGMQESHNWQNLKNDQYPKYTDDVHGYGDKIQDSKHDTEELHGAGQRGPYSRVYVGMMKPRSSGKAHHHGNDYSSETVYLGKAGMAEFYKGSPEYSTRNRHEAKNKYDSNDVNKNKNDKNAYTDKNHYENEYKRPALPPRENPQARVVPNTPHPSPPNQSPIPTYPLQYPPPFLPFGYHPFLSGYPYFPYPYSFGYPGYRLPFPAPVAPVAPVAPAPTPENKKNGE